MRWVRKDDGGPKGELFMFPFRNHWNFFKSLKLVKNLENKGIFKPQEILCMLFLHTTSAKKKQKILENIKINQDYKIVKTNN